MAEDFYIPTNHLDNPMNWMNRKVRWYRWREGELLGVGEVIGVDDTDTYAVAWVRFPSTGEFGSRESRYRTMNMDELQDVETGLLGPEYARDLNNPDAGKHGEGIQQDHGTNREHIDVTEKGKRVESRAYVGTIWTENTSIEATAKRKFGRFY